MSEHPWRIRSEVAEEGGLVWVPECDDCSFTGWRRPAANAARRDLAHHLGDRHDLMPGDAWWLIQTGTMIQLVEAGTSPVLNRRAAEALVAGGIVRRATPAEVSTWGVLCALTAELRGADTAEQRLAILATDTLDVEQGTLL